MQCMWHIENPAFPLPVVTWWWQSENLVHCVIGNGLLMRSINGKRKQNKAGVSRSYMPRDLREAMWSCRPYACHYYNVINHQAMFSIIKKSSGNNQAVCVVDFAENYYAGSGLKHRAAATPWLGDSPSNGTCTYICWWFCCQTRLCHYDVWWFKARRSLCCVYVYRRTGGAYGEILSPHYPRIGEMIVFSDGRGCQYESQKPVYHLSKNLEISQKVT